MSQLQTPLIGVTCLIIHQNQILLVKRGKPPSLGLWSLPGGHLEFGETLSDGARREVREETGLDVSTPQFVENIEIIREDRHYLLCVHRARVIDGQQRIVAGDDASDAQWFDIKRVSELEMTQGTANLIQELTDHD